MLFLKFIGKMSFVLACASLFGCDQNTAHGENNTSNADSTEHPDTADNPDTASAPDTQNTPDSQDDSPGDSQDDTSDLTEDVDTTQPPLPVFQECIGRAFPLSFSGEWEHSISSPLVAVGQAGHSINDLIFVPTTDAVQIEGKFAYGTFSKDLEDEPIQAFIDDCSGWIDLGFAHTDSDGRTRFSLPPNVSMSPGRYEVRMVVQGDGTQTYGFVLVAPAGTQIVVTDIDGTLTTSDSELVQQFFLDIFGGQHVPEMYDGALNMVQAYRDAGYEVLYMTGRPYWLSDITRAWLSTRGFAVGNLHLTATNSEALPSEDGVGTYKLNYLRTLMANYTVVRAYGNAPTDIYAYTGAPLPLSDIFIIGDHAGESGTQPVSDYPSHLGAVQIPPANQPFVR